MAARVTRTSPEHSYEAPPNYWAQFFQVEGSRPTPMEKLAAHLGIDGLSSVLVGLTTVETHNRTGVRHQVFAEDGRLLFDLRDDPDRDQKMWSKFIWWAKTFGDQPPPSRDGKPHGRGAGVESAVPPGGAVEATVGLFSLTDPGPHAFCTASGYTCLFFTDGNGRTILYSPARVDPGPPVKIGWNEAFRPGGELLGHISSDPTTKEWEVLDARATRVAHVTWLPYHPRVEPMRRLGRFSLEAPASGGNIVLPLFHFLMCWFYAGVSQVHRKKREDYFGAMPLRHRPDE